MIISKAIRYLAERLGIKTTGTGISDAIMDLADGFPFGEETKTTITVIGEKTAVADESGLISTGDIWLESGNTYRVTINDEVFEDVAGSSNAEFGNYKYLIVIADVSDEFVGFAGLTPGVNYHIKVETVETETVVTQLPAKYRGFGEEEVTEEIEDYSGEVTGDTGTYTSLPNARFLNMGDLVVTINGEKYYGTSGTSNGVEMMLDLGKYVLSGAILEPGISISGLTPGETYSIQIVRVVKKTVVTPIDIKYLPIDELKAALGLE